MTKTDVEKRVEGFELAYGAVINYRQSLENELKRIERQIKDTDNILYAMRRNLTPDMVPFFYAPPGEIK